MNKPTRLLIAVCVTLVLSITALTFAQNPITPSIPDVRTPTPNPVITAARPAQDARALNCAGYTLPDFVPYVVQAGDTLRDLLGGSGVPHTVTVSQLATLNCIDDPDALPIGAVIYVPRDVLESPAQATPEICAHEWLGSIPNLTCPDESARVVSGAYQPFENGVMLWFSSVQEIYVIDLENGTLQIFEDTYREGELSPDAVAPQGLLTPVRGFGKIWSYLGAERSSLGWAVAPEAGADILIQPAGRTSYTTYIGTPDGQVFAITELPGTSQGFVVQVAAPPM